MKLTLSIMTNKEQKKEIQVNSEQKLIDTLQILIQSGLVDDFDETIPIRIKSLRNGVYINANKSYEEENIYTGDIIRIS